LEVCVTVNKRRIGVSLALGLFGATLALAIAALSAPRADAFGTFSGGVLTVTGGEGKVVPRCASDGELTVSGVPVDDGPVYCRDLRKIVAVGFGVSGVMDFSQLPDDLGGGQGPIEINATGGSESDKLIGAAKHINVFNGGGGSDSVTGGDLNDTLRGGPGGDKLTGGLGNDSLFGGPGGDKLLGGPGRDLLKGGPSGDKLVGGPGKDTESQ
jgi:Ca2+-binding RTX toxin-like protein